MWRKLFGACGGTADVESQSTKFTGPVRERPSGSICAASRGTGHFLTTRSTGSTGTDCTVTDSHPAENNCNTTGSQRDSVESSCAQFIESLQMSPSLDVNEASAVVFGSSCTPSEGCGFATAPWQGSVKDPRPAEQGLHMSELNNPSWPSPTSRLAVALSAYNIRDIAQCDPAMRIRNLKLLSRGTGTAVYKGTWQGLPIAVKFMLYRGCDPATMQRRTTALLAAHCVPQRSHVARVYSFDVSEVYADSAHAGTCTQPLNGCSVGATRSCHAPAPDPTPAATSMPAALNVRPYNDGSDAESFLQPHSPVFPCGSMNDPGAVAGSSPVHKAAAAASSATAGARRGGGGAAARFHFSSVVFYEAAGVGGGARAAAAIPPAPAAAVTQATAAAASMLTSEGTSTSNCSGHTANSWSHPHASAPSPGPTLHSLLGYLGARPGDYLVHCVMELAPAGNLWHGVESGVYDLDGPMGPLGALRMLVHSARGVAQGLQQLHQAGDVHGGLTPSNVLFHWGDGHGGEGRGREREAGRSGGGGGQSREASPSSSSASASRRRGLTARIGDCGMRRLVLEGRWREMLEGNQELAGCSAPELLAAPGAAAPAAGAAGASEALARSSGSEASTAGGVEWAPSQDVFSFGALLRCMCWGSQACGLPGMPSSWPPNVWPPLRSLGESCMAENPGSRPRANEIIKTLLVLEQRLCYPSRARYYLNPALGAPGGTGAPSRMRTELTPGHTHSMRSAAVERGITAGSATRAEGQAERAGDDGREGREGRGQGASPEGCSSGSPPAEPEAEGWAGSGPNRRRPFALVSMPEVLLRSSAPVE